MWDEIRNQLLFPFRQTLPRLRKRYQESSRCGSVDQEWIEAEMAQGLSEESLRLASYYSWILDQVPWKGPEKQALSIDIGSKNFFYAPALYAWLQKRNSATELMGLEADPARLYQNFYQRQDYAHYYVNLINRHYPLGPYAYYQKGNWLTHPAREYDLITSFFPFIYDDLSDSWGLPRRYFDPKAFYRKCAEESPWVLFFHQGLEERDDSLHLIEDCGKGRVIFDQSFDQNPYLEKHHPTCVLLWKTR